MSEAMKQYGVVIALVLVVVGVLYIAFSVAAGAVTFELTWFSKLLRDANMGDLAVFFIAWMILK